MATKKAVRKNNPQKEKNSIPQKSIKTSSKKIKINKQKATPLIEIRESKCICKKIRDYYVCRIELPDGSFINCPGSPRFSTPEECEAYKCNS